VKVSEAWVLPYATLIVTTFPQAARVGLRGVNPHVIQGLLKAEAALRPRLARVPGDAAA
jgi:hypothetical protein